MMMIMIMMIKNNNDKKPDDDANCLNVNGDIISLTTRVKIIMLGP